MTDSAPSATSLANHAKRTLVSVCIFLAMVVLLLALWNFADVMLLSLAGILLAVGWRGLAAGVAAYTPLPTDYAVWGVIVLFFLLLFGGGWWLIPSLINGLEDLFERLPESLKTIEQALEGYPSIEKAMQRVMQTTDAGTVATGVMNRLNNLFSATLGIFSTSLGGLVGILVVIALAMYLAGSPATYLNGALALLPPSRRAHFAELAGRLAHGLRWWLVGRLASMAVVGLLTWFGLLLLGIQSAAALAFIAGLLSFVPNIGPVLSAVPALIVGLAQGPMTMVYVGLLYTAVQTVESYAITPMIQQKVITLPPALVIFAQLFLGVAFGFMGLLLATPLALITVTCVKQLYLEDVYHEHNDAS